MPIIFITAFPEDSIRARAMKAGAVCFMSKPYSEEHLIGLPRPGAEDGLIPEPPACAFDIPEIRL